jgi:hypothetical protein
MECRTEKMTPNRTNVRISPLTIPTTGRRATRISRDEREEAVSPADDEDDVSEAPSSERLSFPAFRESLAESPPAGEGAVEDDDDGDEGEG